MHEIIQRSDGSLSVRIPPQVAKRFAQPAPTVNLTIAAPSGYACALAGETPDACLLSASLFPSPDAKEFGLILRSDSGPENCFQLRLCPHQGTIALDRWPRPGDQTFDMGLTRPLPPAGGQGEYELQIILDGTAATAYIQGQAALSFRLYETAGTHWGTFIQDGRLTSTLTMANVSP